MRKKAKNFNIMIWGSIACLAVITFLFAAAPASAEESYDYVVTDYGVNGNDTEADRADIQAVLDMVKGAN